jgi:hypothetical protein
LHFFSARRRKFFSDKVSWASARKEKKFSNIFRNILRDFKASSYLQLSGSSKIFWCSL